MENQTDRHSDRRTRRTNGLTARVLSSWSFVRPISDNFPHVSFKDMKKFGGPGKLRQKCRLRQCLVLSRVRKRVSEFQCVKDQKLVPIWSLFLQCQKMFPLSPLPAQSNRQDIILVSRLFGKVPILRKCGPYLVPIRDFILEGPHLATLVFPFLKMYECFSKKYSMRGKVEPHFPVLFRRKYCRTTKNQSKMTTT